MSLNYKDRLLVDGSLAPELSLPYTPTSDIAGEVLRVGSAVTRFKGGDRLIQGTGGVSLFVSA